MGVLLQHGADANAFGSERSTPLHFMALAAPERQPLRIATMLVQYGASATIPNRFGKTAHDLARFHGEAGLADFLFRCAAQGHGAHQLLQVKPTPRSG